MTVDLEQRRARLMAAADRIRRAAPAVPEQARTAPDPDTGERWDRGQVLAHVTEMLPYWARQAEVVAERGGGVPFGRVKSDPERIAAIERDRSQDPERLLERMDHGVRQVVGLLDRLDAGTLARTGRHERLGEMTVAAIVDRFLVEHLEEHADQLEEER
ncbi:MAG TPA: DinB family protein [Actinomycetes bacterium]|jgi:hypothetical protein|nr:DinB family protein [Actinomycetes bacterium]